MKRLIKIVLSLLIVATLSQLPFAYRRYRIGRLHAAIQRLQSTRAAKQNQEDVVEYKGVIHVHSFLGGHSTGTFEDIIAAAKGNQLDFVIMTEHPSKNFDTAAMTLSGVHGGVQFLNGNEVVTSNQDRFLVAPGDATAAAAGDSTTQELIAREKAKGSLVLVAYPQEFKSWGIAGFDGVEVYNVFTNAMQVNRLVTFFDGIWSFRSYPDLLFANFYQRPDNSLKLWDDAIATTNKKIIATAGNDAHANIGIALNDSSGKTLLGIKLDPYERSFRLVRMHVLIPRTTPLTVETLLAALRGGHCFIAFDLFCDSTGFSFSAVSGSERKIQGDEINFGTMAQLSVRIPVNGRVVLIRDGSAIQERSGISEVDFAVPQRGVYRVEVYLSQLPKPISDQPWIISNPIYVR